MVYITLLLGLDDGRIRGRVFITIGVKDGSRRIVHLDDPTRRYSLESLIIRMIGGEKSYFNFSIVEDFHQSYSIYFECNWMIGKGHFDDPVRRVLLDS